MHIKNKAVNINLLLSSILFAISGLTAMQQPADMEAENSIIDVCTIEPALEKTAHDPETMIIDICDKGPHLAKCISLRDMLIEAQKHADTNPETIELLSSVIELRSCTAALTLFNKQVAEELAKDEADLDEMKRVAAQKEAENRRFLNKGRLPWPTHTPRRKQATKKSSKTKPTKKQEPTREQPARSTKHV